jgi:hypothetical protein
MSVRSGDEETKHLPGADGLLILAHADEYVEVHRLHIHVLHFTLSHS